MRFLVTGGAGFVGNNIVRVLLKNNHSVVVIDNFHSSKRSNLSDISDKIEIYQVDIREYDKIKEISKKMDGIFHQAALTVVQESFSKKEEYYDVNVKGTQNILKIAKEYDIKVVFASSSSVYGDTRNIPIKEIYEKKPINPYGDTKLQAENIAKKYAEEGLDVIGLRYFNIYGKGQTLSYAGVITKFLQKIKEKKPLTIFGDGKQIRDFIHVEDVAEANLIAMTSKIRQDFYNIGTGIPTSINELAEIIMSISKQNLDVIHLEELEGDVRKSLADISLTKEKLNWNSKIKLEQGLKSFFRLGDYSLSKFS